MKNIGKRGENDAAKKNLRNYCAYGIVILSKGSLRYFRQMPHVRLSYISMHDAMTGCLNRRGMYQRVNNMLEISDDSLLMSVYVIDMDRLKYVNDVFGHSEGDFCIMSLSYAIRNILKDKEICVRAGGDEFYIIGMGTYSDEEENERIKKLSEFLDSFNANSGKPYTLSASIGRAMGKPTCMEDFNKLLSAADAKMYAVKQDHKQQGER